MSLLVVGSVAFDAVETPHGKVDRMLGGAATYFSVAASFFTHVNLVGVVGEDFTRARRGHLSRAGASISPAWNALRARRSFGPGVTAPTRTTGSRWRRS